MLAPPLAHLGHWYVSLPVFMGPVLVLVIALKIQTWRERRQGPDGSGKRSTVTTTRREDGSGATIAVTGPLDYPAVLDLEMALGGVAGDTPEIVLDLLAVTAADEQAAWSLCDAVGRMRAGSRVTALVRAEAEMQSLRTICATEGVRVLDSAALLHVDELPAGQTVDGADRLTTATEGGGRR
jgi:hypothetical protein